MNCCARCDLEAELRRVGSSPLLARGGVGLYRGLVGQPLLARMLGEATARPARLDVVGDDECDQENVRGGRPSRRLRSVPGGPAQDELFGSPHLGAFVAQEVGASVRPLGARGSYTIYAGDGSHLAIHRDVVGCDVALITCLHDEAPGEDGGALEVWFDDMLTPLNALRSQPATRSTRIPVEPRDTMLIHGGVLPHRVPPVRSLRARVVSIMCFEICRHGRTSLQARPI